MSEGKQIEEIAIMFVNFCEDELGADISLEIGEDFAEKLIAEGWRKEIWANWIRDEAFDPRGADMWICSNCRDRSRDKTWYCRRCGAKMKGGE